ncbi:orotidine-5'-phosphate decarboxylase [Paucilactobacillus kaifaensis]|uniref:orotidine-5'-phosphate decarboxylase n=1 Tax=Paucilactobacillus kaifaensis TaxID=2559921 RepID=UPI0010F552BC|nr:orotidine-5'-phosphate decarboxylase [Paucilactobacillus kaifaensis]
MIKLAPIVAIDVADLTQVTILLKELSVAPRPIIKIGMELFYHFGPALVRQVQQAGFAVFLDLKLHDIPNTVERAMKVIGALGVQFTTIHAAGGLEMLTAGKRGLIAGAQSVGAAPARLLAITQLTSIDEQILHEQQHVSLSLGESVQEYARLSQSAGLAGVVCSAQEVSLIRPVVDASFLCITPGIRPLNAKQDDQKRVVTPAQARQLSTNGIVVGRPITQAKNAQRAYQQIAAEFMEE